MTKGKFGIHGGQFVPETLMNAINEFEEAYNRYKDDPEFVAATRELRPTASLVHLRWATTGLAVASSATLVPP